MANKKSFTGAGIVIPKPPPPPQSDDSKDYNSLKTVLFYCSMIVFFPIFTFFSLKAAVLDNFFKLDDLRSNIYSAVGAVVSLHVALGLYIYRAYYGSTKTKGD